MLAVSHLVLATEDVARLTSFFRETFEITPYFENSEFSEFVLPSRFRIAFFKPVGVSAKHFSSAGNRSNVSYGVTVKDVDAFYNRVQPAIASRGGSVSGAPKDHPWGEKSFLLTDPDGNRWEITQAPGEDGMLKNR